MIPFTIEQTLDLASRHHQAGRLREAGIFTRQVGLGASTRWCAASRLRVRWDAGFRYCCAIPFTIEQTLDLASQHHLAGRLREAENLYRQVLAQEPEHAGALHFLGAIARQTGRNDVSVELDSAGAIVIEA